MKTFVISLLGELSVRSSLVSLPYFDEYYLEIVAVDSGNPQLSARSFVNIHVQLNKPPVFSKTFHFDVFENSSIDQTIGRIESKMDDSSTFAFSLKAETGKKMVTNGNYWSLEKVQGRMKKISELIKNDTLNVQIKKTSTFEVLNV